MKNVLSVLEKFTIDDLVCDIKHVNTYFIKNVLILGQNKKIIAPFVKEV